MALTKSGLYLISGIFLSAAVLTGTLATPDGAPPQACKDMKPGHGAEAQQSYAPYEIIPEKVNRKQ